MSWKIVENIENKKIFLELSRSEANHKEGIRLGFHDGGAKVVREIRNLIKNGSKTGRVYFIKGRAHQASAPGESPANRTGMLLNSSSYEVRGPDEMEVGEISPYAKFLEDGTKKMAPRPHVIVATRKKAIDVMNAITKRINEQIGI